MSIMIDRKDGGSLGEHRVTVADVKALASRSGIVIPEKNLEGFRVLLDSVDLCAQKVLDLDDYTPRIDHELYPRSREPMGNDEDVAWAAKVRVESTKPSSTLLSGRTIVLKDNIALAGIPVINGGVSNWLPTFDATIVKRVLDSGAIISGKATCESACLSVVSDTSAAGTVHNPYAHGYSAGGSSSGCARLVALEMVDMALGTDQGGSIRIPAAACGLVGLKPTWGLVPYTGIIGHAATIDHTGPICKDVKDCALLLEAIAGSDGIDDRQSAIRGSDQLKYSAILKDHLRQEAKKQLHGIKIGILKEGFEDEKQDAQVEQCVRAAIEKFKALGASISSCSVPSHRSSALVWMCAFPTITVNQGMLLNGLGRKELALTDLWASSQGRITQKTFDAFGSGGQNVLLRGCYLRDKYGPELAARCINQLRKLSDEYDAAFTDVDLLVMPTVPAPPGKVYDDADSGELLERLYRTVGVTSNTAPFNASGHPALSLPVGMSKEGSVQLPIGMQIVGRKFEEMTVIKAAASWEAAYNWRDALIL